MLSDGSTHPAATFHKNISFIVNANSADTRKMETNTEHNKLRKLDANETLEDGKHNLVKCGECKAPLADLWLTKPNAPVHSRVIVLCPHCGDESFAINVQGIFQLGVTEYTLHNDTEMDVEEIKGVIFQKVKVITSLGEKRWQ
jgi:hypothetical protein